MVIFNSYVKLPEGNPKCVRLMCFDRWVHDSFRVTTDVGDEPQCFFSRPNGDAGCMILGGRDYQQI